MSATRRLRKPLSLFRSDGVSRKTSALSGPMAPFYLANREAIAAYPSDQEGLSEEVAAKQPPLPESLSKKLNRAREEALPR
jgi:hypothetical protein